jgi:hypothetical protein
VILRETKCIFIVRNGIRAMHPGFLRAEPHGAFRKPCSSLLFRYLSQGKCSGNQNLNAKVDRAFMAHEQRQQVWGRLNRDRHSLFSSESTHGRFLHRGTEGCTQARCRKGHSFHTPGNYTVYGSYGTITHLPIGISRIHGSYNDQLNRLADSAVFCYGCR